MNSLISANNYLSLPLSQLNPHCDRLLNSLKDGSTNQKDRVLLEQTLWNEVKKIRALKDSSLPIFLYLIGYYNKILFQVARTSSPDDLFQYHVLIRLGDLNRYMEQIEVAEYYYCNARNLFPYFGHAYNQLGLLTKSPTCYKCCYYYARAAKSSDRPLMSIADSNLRIAVNKYNCHLLNHILNETTPFDLSKLDEDYKLPATGLDWFYVMVVAIYADNIQSIAKLYLTYINENFSTQSATINEDCMKSNFIHLKKDEYILLASLDILLDWLKLGAQGKSLLPLLVVDLRRIKSSINAAIKFSSSQSSLNTTSSSNITTIEISSSQSSSSNKNSSMNTSNSTLQDSFMTGVSDRSNSKESLAKHEALPHDYILRGFQPLDIVHQELIFKFNNQWDSIDSRMTTRGDIKNKDAMMDRALNESDKLLNILLRIRSKIDSFGSLIKKRTRNIALESILSNMNAN